MGKNKMDYRDILGFSKKQPKKKVEKKVAPKPTTPPITELLKEEFGPLNEWSEVDAGPKRWSKPMNSGLTEFEKEQMNEGPAYEYEPYMHAISQNYDKYWDSVKDFQKLLGKKGLNQVSGDIGLGYMKFVTNFTKCSKK